MPIARYSRSSPDGGMRCCGDQPPHAERAHVAERHRRARRLALPRSPTYTTFKKPFYAHFSQFLSSLAFDKKTSALRRSFLVPTFVYRHRFISLLVIRMPISYMTEVRRRTGRLLGLHSITSSARASSEGGASRLRAFAVLRLMTNLNFVGACTGRSPGFSPLRIRFI